MTSQGSIWISAAEPSADLHGSNLVKSLSQLAPDIQYIGIGGSEMRQTNFQALIPAEDLSVMGLSEVITILPRIIRLYQDIKKHFLNFKPLCIVLIDAPDFHFPIAKMAYRLNIPVFYYISPQVWAWRKNRINFLKKYISKILCIIPFEKRYFQDRGIDVDFVGHPLLEQIDFSQLDSLAPINKTIGFMPGSRTKVINQLFPKFVKAAKIISTFQPQAEFVLIKAQCLKEEYIYQCWPKYLPLKIIPFSHRYSHMKQCQMILTTSGTSSLECALLGIPAIIAYRLSWISFFIAKLVVNTPYIGLPNLILEKKVFPEYIQNQATGENLAYQVFEWLSTDETLESIVSELRNLRSALSYKKASQRSAQIIIDSLS